MGKELRETVWELVQGRKTFGEAIREQSLDGYDRDAGFARRHAMTGDELRAGIDKWGVPYTRVAGWLGLTVDGLHKQMRGTRAVSLQTRLLFNKLARDFQYAADHTGWTQEELQHPDTPAFRSQLRREAKAEARKLGISS